MKRFNTLVKALVLTSILMIAFSYGVLSAEDSVLITGFEEEIRVSVEELRGLTAVDQKVVSVDSSGDESEYTIRGALLSDLLKKYGKSQDNVRIIRFVAGDGYAIEADESILRNRRIILAYLHNGQALKEESRPIRLVIPEERAMYWVKNLVRIEVIEHVNPIQLEKMYFLESIIPNLNHSEYNYYDSVDKAVKVSGLLEKVGLSDTSRTIQMRAVDGLEKSEQRDTFESGYIKITGNDAPMFLSPDIPKGMYVKDLLYINYGENVICSFQQALGVINKVDMDDKSGIELSTLLKESGLLTTDSYIFEAVDGYSVEISAEDIANGVIYYDEKGQLRSYFRDLPGNTSVKQLYSIEPVLQ